jgi:hypothetical protein
MFSALRIAIIVGLIFYYSPVRQAPGSAAEETRSTATSTDLAALFEVLPEDAKQSIAERIAASILGAAPAPSRAAQLLPPTDTLEPEDLRPAWKGASAPAAPHS